MNAEDCDKSQIAELVENYDRVVTQFKR